MFFYHGSSDRIVTMTTTDPIIIPRSELPEVVVTNHGSGHSFRIKEGSSVDATARQKALEYLAVAEAIDDHHAKQAKAKADAEAKVKVASKAKEHLDLMHEASQLCFAGTGDNIFRASLTASDAYEHWMNVARAARELHGK